MPNIAPLIAKLPKAELHLHIEGTLEPDMMLKLSEKNGIKLPYKNSEDVHQAYQFDNLQSFLDLYYLGAQSLVDAQDFYDLTWAYLQRLDKDHVTHCEIFFDPQTHTDRGIRFDTVLDGIHQALKDAEKKLNISSHIILCFLRHLSEEQAFETLKQALPHQDKIIGVGLDSSEQGHPPTKFKRVFEEAIRHGFKTVAHAGEEGPANYIWQAIQELNIERVDHGVRCLGDPALVDYLREHQIPLTVCPLSNVKLKVFEHIKQHNLPALLKENLCVTLNSDDPAYFGGYLNQNYQACMDAFNLSQETVVQLARNSFQASFLTNEQKATAMKEIDKVIDLSKSA